MSRNPTIGLEIHIGLKTERKMFCGCKNDPSEKRPNYNVCPICLGHPGTLPTPNKKAIKEVIRMGYALGGKITEHTKFDRKNYFYPDIPKGYQISQYDQPLVTGGSLAGIRITRIHLEEDVGRLLHGKDTFAKGGSTLVDYNRAGVPLMELVTEPDLRSAGDTTTFAKQLRLIARYLEASDADMEKGLMRIEANVSLDMGTKTELKNINSFRAVHDAVLFEIQRQGEALDKGEEIVQETRGWDEVRKVTVSQRAKENAHDYRYFPEPDIPPFSTKESFDLEVLKSSLPELPDVKQKRFMDSFGLDEEQSLLMVENPGLAGFFEEAVSELKAENPDASITMLYNYLTSDLRGIGAELKKETESLMKPTYLAQVVSLLQQKKILSRQAKDLIRKIVETGDDPQEIMESENMGIVSDEGVIDKAIQEVLARNPDPVAEYKKGKVTVIKFLLGQAMGALKGQADPQELEEAIEKALKA